MKKLLKLTIFVITLLCSSQLFAYNRDWEKFPPYVVVENANRVCAIGDIHGAFDELSNSLRVLKVATLSKTEKFRFDWIGGKTVLVFTGDFTDRGKYTKQVYDSVIDLQEKALKAGGRVIATIGNHEAMLLSGQIEYWSKTRKDPVKRQNYINTIVSFTNDGLDFHEAISEKGKYGIWIRNLPLFAIVNGYMFVHGGICNKPTTKTAIAAEFKECITKGDFSKGIFMSHNDVLWNRKWWDDDILVSRNLKTFGIKGVIFGHTIGALGSKGTIYAKDKRLVSIDIGMSPAYANSVGGGIEILKEPRGIYRFTAHYPDRPSEELFTVNTEIAQ